MSCICEFATSSQCNARCFMPLSIYRLHTKSCAANRPRHDRNYRKCNCTIHVSGSIAPGDFIRESLHTREWSAASKRILEAEARGWWKSAPGNDKGKPVSEAFDAFLADAESVGGRRLKPQSAAKYRTLQRRLNEFCKAERLISIADITGDDLRAFRARWPPGARAAANHIARLKCVFQWFVDQGWIESNPAAVIKAPKLLRSMATQKQPFSEAEMERMLDLAKESPGLYALVLLLRTTGLRIGDAALLRSENIIDGHVHLVTAKTSSQVNQPLQPEVLAALDTLPKITKDGSEYYFLLGRSTRMQTAAELWRRRLIRLMRAAEVSKPHHPHRFRHTMAVSLLLEDMSTENVSKLLTHSSPQITSQFYSSWSKERQAKLAEELRKTWKPKKAA